jgi:hypothetical protein
LRINVSPEVASLADQYRQALDNYLRHHGKAGLARLTSRGGPPKMDRTMQETLRVLDALDARRTELTPRPEPGDDPKKEKTGSIVNN